MVPSTPALPAVFIYCPSHSSPCSLTFLLFIFTFYGKIIKKKSLLHFFLILSRSGIQRGLSAPETLSPDG